MALYSPRHDKAAEYRRQAEEARNLARQVSAVSGTEASSGGRMMKNLGFGRDYRYAHDEEGTARVAAERSPLLPSTAPADVARPVRPSASADTGTRVG